MYAPNKIASKYMKQKLSELKGEIDKSTTTVGAIKLLSQQLIEQGDSKSAK